MMSLGEGSPGKACRNVESKPGYLLFRIHTAILTVDEKYGKAQLVRLSRYRLFEYADGTFFVVFYTSPWGKGRRMQ